MFIDKYLSASHSKLDINCLHRHFKNAKSGLRFVNNCTMHYYSLSTTEKIVSSAAANQRMTCMIEN